jgi:hypothetical protein
LFSLTEYRKKDQTKTKVVNAHSELDVSVCLQQQVQRIDAAHRQQQEGRTVDAVSA